MSMTQGRIYLKLNYLLKVKNSSLLGITVYRFFIVGLNVLDKRQW